MSSHVLPVREDGSAQAFNDISVEAMRNNAIFGVDTFLLCTPHWFCQQIEGPEGAVRRMLHRIAKDPRHFDLRLIEARPAPRLLRDGWRFAMVYKSIENRLAFLERGFSRAIVPYDRSAEDILDLFAAMNGVQPSTVQAEPVLGFAQ
ncbi:BLUF domain-containing protein [Alsobacter sp. KACC 23698]|uniref:BLUF domain-containing protein n=1 Tax=Alsobacter sp. KACC 23698 TaxID=3149229 RepID=UPI003877B8B2